MNKNITATSQSQIAIFKIDHRLIECRFFRVSGPQMQDGYKITHPVLLQAVRDAGANLEWPSDRSVESTNTRSRGNDIRRHFNRRGFVYSTQEEIAKLVKE